MAFVAEFKRETSGVEMGAALAVFVNETAISEERAALAVRGRKFVKRQKMHHAGEEIVRVRRTAGDGDDVVAAERLGDAH